MAITPSPLVWDFWRESGQTAISTGGLIDYHDTKAQELLPQSPNGGVSSSDTTVSEGNWEDAEWSDFETIDTAKYRLLDFDHPARGAWYGVAALDKTDAADEFYLLKYEYEKRLDNLNMNGSITMQTDNPIEQLNMAIINTGRKTFLSDSTIFSPGAKIETGIRAGNSSVYPMGIFYIDEIGYDVFSDTVSVSARNTIGYKLATQTFDDDVVYSGRISQIVVSILQYFGIVNMSVEIVEEEISLKFEKGTSGLAALTKIAEHLSSFASTVIQKLWRFGELPSGTIVAGFEEHFEHFIHNDNYVFDIEHEVFSYSVNRCADNAYTQVIMTGTDEDGEALEPVTVGVYNNAAWDLGTHRTYHGSADGVTQDELYTMAINNSLMLRNTGDVASVSMTIKPQLLIGDFAKVRYADGETEDMGIITSLTHRFGKSGFFTDLTADKSGIAFASGDHVVTRTMSINGSARVGRLTDYFAAKKE